MARDNRHVRVKTYVNLPDLDSIEDLSVEQTARDVLYVTMVHTAFQDRQALLCAIKRLCDEERDEWLTIAFRPLSPDVTKNPSPISPRPE